MHLVQSWPILVNSVCNIYSRSNKKNKNNICIGLLFVIVLPILARHCSRPRDRRRHCRCKCIA